MNYGEKLDVFPEYKCFRETPEDSRRDSCPAHVEGTQLIGVCGLSKVAHRELQVFCGEELISNVKFLQCLAPFLSYHMDAGLWRR